MSFFSALRGLISDTVSRAVRVDASTHAINTITYPHHEIHSGSSFTCTFTNDVTNIGERTAIAFNTPAGTKWVHLIIEAGSTGLCYVGLYEAPSIDVDEGTQLTIYNRKRSSGTASTILSIETVPVANKATSYNEGQAAGANITTTTELVRNILGTGTKKTIGGGERGSQEWELAPGVQYVVLMHSLTNDDATHTLTLDWYEHTDKD